MANYVQPPKDMPTEGFIYKYILYEYGLEWHPSGWVTVHQVWSDGTETEIKKPCRTVIRDISLHDSLNRG